MEDHSDSADPFSLLLEIKSVIEQPFFTYLFQSLVIVILLFLSGLISSIELAFTSLTSDHLNSFRNGTTYADKRITYLNLNLKKVLNSVSIIKYILNTSIISLATYFTLQNTWENYHSELIVGLILLLIISIIFFNEIFPKILIKENVLSFSQKSSLFLWIVFKVFHPISRIISSFNTIPIEKKQTKKTYIVSSSNEQEDSSENNSVDISTNEETPENSLSFDSISVKQIMVNRLDITAFDWNLTFNELLKEVNKYGYSRIPIYKDNMDSIEGILYVKDLLIHLEKKLQFDWHQLIRPGFFVPDSKKIEDLLKDFQEKKVHMAIVVDEYGGTSGLVTLEDILEEIVGEIHDEFDKNHMMSYSQLDDRTFIFEGKTSLAEFGRIYNIDLKEFDHQNAEVYSLGDFLLRLFIELPSIGDQITFNKFEFTIISVEKEKINRVKVFIKDQSNKEGILVNG